MFQILGLIVYAYSIEFPVCESISHNRVDPSLVPNLERWSDYSPGYHIALSTHQIFAATHSNSYSPILTWTIAQEAVPKERRNVFLSKFYFHLDHFTIDSCPFMTLLMDIQYVVADPYTIIIVNRTPWELDILNHICQLFT